ncbi:MAG: alanine racemase [Holophaga sp.]|nr:alanine racemase [Holophaga sp.]
MAAIRGSTVAMDPLQPLLDTLLDARTKGFPQDAQPLRLGDIAEQHWNLFQGDLGSPVALLRRDVMDANARWMKDFLARCGASLCPHGKTTLAPQLFHRQLESGAWGITLATPQQAQVAFAYGVKRVLLANELTEPAALRGLSAALNQEPSRELLVFADSAEAVVQMEKHWCGSRSLMVLVETGIPGGRCGARGMEAALSVARAVKMAPRLRLAGVACYEGIVISQEPVADRTKVTEWLEDLVALARRCEVEGIFEAEEIILTAGGSAYFDLVAKVLMASGLQSPTRVVLRSGCYLTHDAGHYQRLVALLEGRLDASWRPQGHLAPALEVWARVLSRPEPGLAFLDAGKRDLPHDLGLPRPGRWFSPGSIPLSCPETWRLTSLYDQHARLEVPAESQLQVGDLVGLAVSHPCTTFDKWPVVFEMDEAGQILGAIKTCF